MFSASGNPAHTSVCRAKMCARATAFDGVVAAVLASPAPISSASAFRTIFSISSECQFTGFNFRQLGFRLIAPAAPTVFFVRAAALPLWYQGSALLVVVLS